MDAITANIEAQRQENQNLLDLEQRSTTDYWKEESD